MYFYRISSFQFRKVGTEFLLFSLEKWELQLNDEANQYLIPAVTTRYVLRLTSTPRNNFQFLLFFFKILLISPFYGATDTPVLDFWWCLLWVSKSKWVIFLHLAEVYVIYVPWDSPLVWHLPISLQPAWQPVASPHTCFSRGRMMDSIRRPPA